MKRLILISIITIQAVFLFGQVSMELYDHDGNEIVDGQNIVVLVEDVNLFETVSPELFPKNVSSETINVKIKVEEIQVVAETMHYFCGLGNCFSPGTMETPDPYAIEAGVLVGSEGFFSSHYMPAGHMGTTIVKYTYFNVDDLDDAISFTVTFVAEVFNLFDHDGNVIINDQEMNVLVTEEELFEEAVSAELFIKNASDITRSIKCRRDVIEEVAETQNYFCALGGCLSPDLDETPRELVLEAGVTIDETGFFSAHYMADGHYGITKIKYTYFDITTPEDKISFFITFNAKDPNAVSNIDQDIEMKAYPNPASSMVNISLTDNTIDNAQLVIYTTLGVKVYSQMVHQDHIQMDLSSLERGVYLYRLEGDRMNSTTSKLILK